MKTKAKRAKAATSANGHAPDLQHITPGLRHLAVPIGDVHFHPRNPRTHPERNLAAIRASLRQNGQYRAAVASNRTGQLVCVIGNGMLAAALAEGWTHLAVEPKLMTEAQENQLAITDNQTAALADWDDEALGAMLRDLDTGNDAELDAMMSALAEERGIIPATGGAAQEDEPPALDRAAELQRKWRTESGQLWVIPSVTMPGKVHRLLCGDSTKAEDVGRVMGGERAGLCFTSPPYAQQRDYGKKIDDWDALMQGVFGNLPMADDGQVLVNLGPIIRDGKWWPYWDGWIQWMEGQAWRLFDVYVWDKLCGLPGAFGGHLRPSHEFAFHFNKKPVDAIKSVETTNAGRKPHHTGKHTKDGSKEDYTHDGRPVQDCKTHDSVIRCAAAKGLGIEHPAVFPVALPAAIISSWPGLCYEPFAGSGSQFVAAEQLGRLCYGIEISPAYVAVCLERLANLGLSPRLESPVNAVADLLNAGALTALAHFVPPPPPSQAEFTEAEIEAALQFARGMVSVAAQKLGCSRQTVYNYFARYPALKVKADEIAKTGRQQMVDVAEVKLWDHVKAGKLEAVKYALDRQGRDRGYVTRQEVTGEGGGAIPIALVREVVVRTRQEAKDILADEQSS